MSVTPNHPAPHGAQQIRESAAQTLEAGRALINRSYLAQLEQYPIQPLANSAQRFQRSSDLRLFRIERIVQANKQSVLESTTAAYTALGAAGYTVFLFLRSDGAKTELYIGTRGEPGKSLGQSSGELLQATFKGHFSGSLLQPLTARDADTLLDTMLEEKSNPAASITAVTGVPALSTDNREHFMQGLERFIDAAESRVYQALILAEPVSSQDLDRIRVGYEQVATQLSPLHKLNLSFGEQESDSVGLSISQSLSESLGDSLAMTETHSLARSTGTSSTTSRGTSEACSARTRSAKAAAILGPAAGGLLGSALGPVGAMIGSQLGSAAATAFDNTRTTGTSESQAEGRNTSESTSTGKSTGRTTSTTSTTGSSDTRSDTRTLGTNRQVSIEATDKSIEQLLAKIDHHLTRIDEAATYGGWNSAAYFIGDSTASSEALASIFLGLVRGNNSSHEDFALTTWGSAKKSSVLDWLGTLSHPPLQHGFAKRLPITYLTPATLVSGKELAIQLSLPRRSTSTVAVMETQAFGRRVQRLDGSIDTATEQRSSIVLGQVRHLWENLRQTIDLRIDQLASHVFISGSTGAGKSNTVYNMLGQIDAMGIPFLVIEPAKGEYKHVFGQRPDVHVFGTNPTYGALLKINPFRFPVQIHVLEHVDRLIEIFNVCWPMYAAMPAVLKDAILRAYEQAGWDLSLSVNLHGDELFPSFADLLSTLDQVIASSGYSQEVKSNYQGSLSTRIKSLTNGLNGQIFSADEIDSSVLFDSPVIVDLSRVGSAESKSLIMGILVMRLAEYRMAEGGMNRALRHVTVLEEAHHLLKRCHADGGAEGGGLAGKSVEMLTNAIAEMRTFGESFFVVDQSPHAVDMAAIRNTNTKIIMRLPEETDRRLIGKSAALRDEQLDEIARLPRGVAIVYQNDWLEPVLCQVAEFKVPAQPYVHRPARGDSDERENFNRHLLHLLLTQRVHEPADPDLALLDRIVPTLPLLAADKIALLDAIQARRQGWYGELCHPDGFARMARILVDVLECRAAVLKLVRSVSDYGQLHHEIDHLLSARVGELDAAHRLGAQQCLMKDYCLQHPSHLNIYSAWRASMETRSIA